MQLSVISVQWLAVVYKMVVFSCFSELLEKRFEIIY